MPKPLDPETKKQLASHLNYYREMGIYDFYRRSTEGVEIAIVPSTVVEPEPEEMPVATAGKKSPVFETSIAVIGNKPAALKVIREDIGDCTRCRLHKGRTNLVFGVGNV